MIDGCRASTAIFFEALPEGYIDIDSAQLVKVDQKQRKSKSAVLYFVLTDLLISFFVFEILILFSLRCSPDDTLLTMNLKDFIKPDDAMVKKLMVKLIEPVSYTHLTLPTIYSV